MTAPSLPSPRIALAACALLACSPAAPGHGSRAPAGPSSSPADPPVLDPLEPPAHDPRVVRCGVDDRPRSVSSGLSLGPRLDPSDDPSPPDALDLRPPPALSPGPAPRLRPGDVALAMRIATSRVDSPPPPLLPFFVDLRPPPGAAPPAWLEPPEPPYGACAPLAPYSDPLSPVTLDLELASTGAPLRVTPPGPAPPSPLVRCLMERTCQLRAAPSGRARRVQLPLRPHRGPPLPHASLPGLDAATLDPASSPPARRLQDQLRTGALEAMRRCGPVPGRLAVRLRVDLHLSSEDEPRPGSPPATLDPGGLLAHPLEGEMPPPLLDCLHRRLPRRLDPDNLAPGPRFEWLLLTWSP